MNPWKWIKCNLFNAHDFESWHYKSIRSDAALPIDIKIPIKSTVQIRTRTCASCGRVEMRVL